MNKKCLKRCKETTGECSNNEKWYWVDNIINEIFNTYQIKNQEPGVRVCLKNNFEFEDVYKVESKFCDGKDDKSPCFSTREGYLGYCYKNNCLESCPSVYSPIGFIPCDDEEAQCYSWEGFLGIDDARNNQFCLKDLSQEELEIFNIVEKNNEDDFRVIV